jgi:hypothetical protein
MLTLASSPPPAQETRGCDQSRRETPLLQRIAVLSNAKNGRPSHLPYRKRPRATESDGINTGTGYGMACAAVKVKPQGMKNSAGLLVSPAADDTKVSRRSSKHCRSLFGDTEIKKVAAGTEVLHISLKAGSRSS